MSNYLYNIPLKLVVIPQKGIKPAILKDKMFEGSLPYLDISVLETGIIKEYTYKELGNIATPDDILIVWDGSRSGLCFKGRLGVIGSTLMSLTPVLLDPEYMFYFLKSKFHFLNGNTSGTGIPHVNSEIFFNLEIPLISPEKQKQVINEIVLGLKNNSVLLKEQENLIKSVLSTSEINFNEDVDMEKTIQNFTQAIVDQAVSGKLSEDWRIKNKVTQIFKWDETKYTSGNQIANWQIPENWTFKKLKNVVNSFEYGTSSKSTDSGKVPVLRMGNIKENKIDWTNLKYTSSTEDIIKYKLQKGDVLFNRTNSPELVGKSSIYDSDIEAIFAGYLIRIKPQDILNPKFLAYCLNSSFAKNFYTTIIIGSANQANISAKRLSEFQIPIPSLQEQNKIVNIVEELLSTAQIVKKQHEESITDFFKLEQSLLQKAFSSQEKKSDLEKETLDYLLTQISLEKNKKETQKQEVSKIHGKIRSTMKKAENKTPEYDIEEILKHNNKKMSAKDLWNASKYKGDIDAFYEAMKNKVGVTTEWELIKEDEAVPESIISLKSKTP